MEKRSVKLFCYTLSLIAIVFCPSFMLSMDSNQRADSPIPPAPQITNGSYSPLALARKKSPSKLTGSFSLMPPTQNQLLVQKAAMRAQGTNSKIESENK